MMIVIIKSLQSHNKIIKSLLVLAGIGWFIIPGVARVEAKTLVFEDDFSAGLTKWQSVRPYEEYWSVSDSGQATAYVPYPSTVVELVPKDEYWSSDWKNLEYVFDYYTYEGGDKNISFGYRNNQNWYEFHFLPFDSNLVKVKDGQVVWSTWHGTGLTNGQKYSVKLIVNQGQISLYLNGELISVDQDPDFKDDFGKISLKAGTGAVSPTKVGFDNIKVYTLDEVPPPPYVFKQSDPAWSENEYDSASVWSKEETSIKRWGCALTSLAMVLKYHQISTLPDGSTLNPDSLNTWLNNQPDGYFKEGHLNWQAGARLTQLMNEKNGTTKLEYKYLASDQTEKVNQSIANNEPVVINIPGHFLLAEGLTTDQTDWFIRDPAYAYTHFSQHDVAAQSFRQFTPSQTDLSYLIITHDPDLKVELINANTAENETIKLTTYIDYLSADDTTDTTKTANLAISQLAQPVAGSYQLKLTRDEMKMSDLKFYLYDTQGKVKVIDYSSQIGQLPINLDLQLDTTDINLSNLKPTAVTWSSWADKLEPLYHSRDIKRRFVVTILHQAALNASRNPAETKDNFVAYIKNLIDWLSPAIEPFTKDYLKQELDRVSML